MLNPSRKRLYYLIIAGSILGTITILFLLRSSTPSIDTSFSVPHADSKAEAKNVYRIPTIFPQDRKFDLSVLQSGTFKNLTVPQTLQLTPQELGRDNPFKQY